VVNENNLLSFTVWTLRLRRARGQGKGKTAARARVLYTTVAAMAEEACATDVAQWVAGQAAQSFRSGRWRVEEEEEGPPGLLLATSWPNPLHRSSSSSVEEGDLMMQMGEVRDNMD
jgi:hypothetical protein